MILSDYEKQVLDGKDGYPAQKSMQILVQLGEIYGAKRMIPVSRVHMAGSSIVVAGQAGLKFVEKMVSLGGCFKVFTTLNTGAVDLERWEELGYCRETWVQQTRLTKAYEALGAVACHTCTPYLIGGQPHFGEHVAWGESSAIAFVNSVLGGRTNREGGPSGLAAALTGVVPDYGYHLQENRYGHVQVNVETDLADITDYGTLGYWTGTKIASKIPVFTGIPKSATNDQLKMLAAALASSGSVALFHVVGVTPEASDLATAFGGRKPGQVMTFDKRALIDTEKLLNKQQDQKVSLVAIGCPHASIEEIEVIARELDGRALSPGVDLWITVAQPIKAFAERCGYAQTIEKAGGKLVTDTCPILSPMVEVASRKSYQAIATNSAKLAHYAPGQWGMPTYYGSLEKCLKAAVCGKF